MAQLAAYLGFAFDKTSLSISPGSCMAPGPGDVVNVGRIDPPISIQQIADGELARKHGQRKAGDRVTSNLLLTKRPAPIESRIGFFGEW